MVRVYEYNVKTRGEGQFQIEVCLYSKKFWFLILSMCSFQVKLAQHVYSNLFGTFLCNSSQERVQADIGDRSYSVWAFCRMNKKRYTNYLYVSTQQVLYPSCHVKDLRLWTSVYMPEMGEVTADTTTSAHPSVGDDEVSPVMTRIGTKSH